MKHLRLISILTLFLPSLVSAAELTNPLGDITSPADVVATIIKILLGVVGVVALLIVIYGGIELMTSAGSQEKIDKGRKALMWAAIGLVVVFGSYGITKAIFTALAGGSI
jgi:hypothetical protein